MIPREVQDLLERCEAGRATDEDRAALARLLEDQEAEGGCWQALAGAIEREAGAVDLAPTVASATVDATADAAAWAPVGDCLREAVTGGRAVDLAATIMARLVPPSPLDEAVGILARGIQEEAARVDLAPAVMEALAPQAATDLWTSLAVLSEGLRAESADVDLVPAVQSALDGAVQEAAVVLPDLEAAFAGLAEGLLAEAGPADLADAVLSRIEAEASWGQALSALADGELAPEERRRVAARLMDDREARALVMAHVALGREVRQAVACELAEARPPELWPAVARELDLEVGEGLAALAEGLAAEAPDLADAVMGRLFPAPAPAPARTVPERGPARAPVAAAARPRRSPVVAVLLSAAAALLLVNVIGPPAEGPGPVGTPAAPQAAIELAEVNQTEIEDLSVAADAVVQVFQLEDGAPMFIMINESPQAREPEGVTL